jgi:hypothetical protein
MLWLRRRRAISTSIRLVGIHIHAARVSVSLTIGVLSLVGGDVVGEAVGGVGRIGLARRGTSMIWVLLLMLGRDVLLHDGRAVLGEDEESIDDAEQKRTEGSSNSKEGGGVEVRAGGVGNRTEAKLSSSCTKRERKEEEGEDHAVDLTSRSRSGFKIQDSVQIRAMEMMVTLRTLSFCLSFPCTHCGGGAGARPRPRSFRGTVRCDAMRCDAVRCGAVYCTLLSRGLCSPTTIIPLAPATCTT